MRPRSLEGYISEVDAEKAVDTPKVVAYGTVDGELFSLYTWTNEHEGACLGMAGPGGDDFASPDPQPPGAWGGLVAATCAPSHGVPTEQDLHQAGWNAELTADTGFVSERVDRLLIRSSDGTEVPGASPEGVIWLGGDANVPLLPPEWFDGTLVAMDADGVELAMTEVCTYTGQPGAVRVPCSRRADP